MKRHVGPSADPFLEHLLDLGIGVLENAAVRVMDDQHLARAQQVLGDDQGSKSIGGAAAGVADHVGVALLQPQEARGIEPGIHARDDRDLPPWGSGQVPLREATGISGVRAEKPPASGQVASYRE